jgi:ArsR family transcriptional regulator, lead/cadmium/zinc/bismuth-responsive transcriptional repressor
MAGCEYPLAHEVKCANCGSYYPLDLVKQESNGYYCRKCYQAREEAANGKADEENRCLVCGKVLVPEEVRVLYANASYCIACYDKSTPYLTMKPFGPQLGDTLASMRTDKKVLCGKCGRDLGPFDVKVLDGGATYCEKCYGKVREATGNRRFFLAEQAGINTRPGVTSLKDATNLVECANCGWVITRDRLEKDARGKLRCPRCGKKSDVPPEKKKDKEIVCSVCGRPDMQQRWVHEGKVYCETCHKNLKAVTEKKADPGKVNTGVSFRPGVTTVEDPGKLIACPSCDIVLTRDRLKENKQGKPCCPKCGEDLSSLISVPEKSGTKDYNDTAQLFKCLGDPCRIKIIDSLSKKELCVFEFVEITGYQYSALSYHLKTLKEMDLIKSFERGNFMVYSLTDKGQVIHEFIKQSKSLK